MPYTVALWASRRDGELLEQIGQIHRESQGTYGWPRIHAELRHRGVRVSRKRVARLMRAAGLSGLVRRRSWPTRRELQIAVFAWIEGSYNRRRLHSTLSYLSPVDYETELSGRTVRASPLRGSHTHPS